MVWSGQSCEAALFMNAIPVMLICTMLLVNPKRRHYTVDLEELKGIYRVTLIFMSLYTGGHFTAPLHCSHYTIIFSFRNVAIWINSYSTIYCTSDGEPPRTVKKHQGDFTKCLVIH